MLKRCGDTCWERSHISLEASVKDPENFLVSWLLCFFPLPLADAATDLLHSYLGLAALAIYKEPGLKEFDPTFCMSTDAVERLKNVIWGGS